MAFSLLAAAYLATANDAEPTVAPETQSAGAAPSVAPPPAPAPTDVPQSLRPTLGALFNDRVRSVVAVEFFVETEVDRRPSTVVGMVVDGNGTIALLDSAIPGWLPPAQLKDFRINRPGSGNGVRAGYLGQDFLNGWHFIRARESMANLVPVSEYAAAEPEIGDEIWGIGLMAKEFNFQPYLMMGRVAVLQRLPQRVAFSIDDVTGPGSLVFSLEGDLVGWGSNSVPEQRLLYMDEERFSVRLQNPNGTGGFFLASEVLPYLDRVPEAPTGQEIPWLGVVGLRPVERSVADHLKLGDHSAVMVSDVIEGGPAERAGVRGRDIVVSVDGERFPRFSPETVATVHFERHILRASVGDTMTLGILRGTEDVEIEVEIGRQPKPLKEAERRYFDRLGITLREFVLFDRVSWQLSAEDGEGVVVNFVKPNSQAGAAGLRVGDRITAIDGETVDDFATGVSLLQAVEEDASRNEFVLLVKRGVETSLIRVRLN